MAKGRTAEGAGAVRCPEEPAAGCAGCVYYGGMVTDYGSGTVRGYCLMCRTFVPEDGECWVVRPPLTDDDLRDGMPRADDSRVCGCG